VALNSKTSKGRNSCTQSTLTPNGNIHGEKVRFMGLGQHFISKRPISRGKRPQNFLKKVVLFLKRSLFLGNFRLKL
jgi:hypothetical protein